MRRFSSQEIREFVSRPLFDERVLLEKDVSYPKISVVTPSYNQAKFLERTILSVLNQNYPNLEYIIIDGGSTDGSVDIIKKYEKYLAYWVSEADRGQAHALNKGFEKASGDIYFYLNSDDILLPRVLYRVAKVFSKNPKTDVVYGNKLLISPGDEIVSERRTVRWTSLTPLGFFSRTGFGIYIDSAFFKREIYSLTGGFDEKLRNTMDTDLFLKMVNLSASFLFVREYFIAFRLHGISKTVKTGREIGRKETDYLLAKYYPYDYKIPKFVRWLLKIYWGMLFVTQGDIDYILRRVFVERMKNYQDYLMFEK